MYYQKIVNFYREKFKFDQIENLKIFVYTGSFKKILHFI